MTNVLSRDADALHRALDGEGDEVNVSVSRETTEWLARILDTRSRGHAEVTPAEAAALLGVSRPQVRKMMDESKLGFRMVGAHHRIPIESIEALKAWEREQMAKGMEKLSQLQNELGVFD